MKILFPLVFVFISLATPSAFAGGMMKINRIANCLQMVEAVPGLAAANLYQKNLDEVKKLYPNQFQELVTLKKELIQKYPDRKNADAFLIEDEVRKLVADNERLPLSNSTKDWLKISYIAIQTVHLLSSEKGVVKILKNLADKKSDHPVTESERLRAKNSNVDSAMNFGVADLIGAVRLVFLKNP